MTTYINFERCERIFYVNSHLVESDNVREGHRDTLTVLVGEGEIMVNL